MSFSVDGLRGLIEAFVKTEKEIKGGIPHDNEQKIKQTEIEILSAYNEIVRYAYPIWQSTNKKLKGNVKFALVDIYYRLRSCLDLLEADIKLPTYLTEEIKLRGNNDRTSNMESRNKNDQQPGTSGVEVKHSTQDEATLPNTAEETQRSMDNLRDAELDELRKQIQQMQLSLQAINQAYPVQQVSQYEDIRTKLESGDQIQLESYRSIPEFRGDRKQYRSWRNQVVRRMQMIQNFMTHPKYEAALGIIRAKITGPAADVLTNNKTAYNIHAIIEQLDASYTDKRPLYVVEAEMTTIKQWGKTLQEYYEEINQALNSIISKIMLAYPDVNEQRALIRESQIKAVRTFIVGLKSEATRNIVYGGRYKSLAEAFTTAQTVYYDNQFLNLDHTRESGRNRQQALPRSYNMSRPFQNHQAGVNFKLNCNQQQQGFGKRLSTEPKNYQQPQQLIQPKNGPEQTNMDTFNRNKQATNWQQPNGQMNVQQKRDYNSPRQNIQQPPGFQRINQIQDNGPFTNVEGGTHDGDTYEDIPDDLISNSSHVSDGTNISSAFLD